MATDMVEPGQPPPGPEEAVERTYHVAPHTLFAAVMAVVPSLDGQLLEIGNYGTSLAFLPRDSGNGVRWEAFVRRHPDGHGVLMVRWSHTDASPASRLSSTKEAAQALLDAVTVEVEHLPPVEPAPSTPDTQGTPTSRS